MPVRALLLVGVFGLLLVSAIPSNAQQDGLDAQNTVEAWKKKIVIRLASKKEFPPGANGQGGKAMVKFVIDRQGKLISKELIESTGFEQLDAAALRIIERAEPFPEPPAEVKDDTSSFTVPIVFEKRKLLPWAGGEWPAELVEEQKKVNDKVHGICRGC